MGVYQSKIWFFVLHTFLSKILLKIEIIQMKITIQNFFCGDIELEVDPSETIGDIKQKIYEINGFTPLWQGVFVEGKWFVDEMKISNWIFYSATKIIFSKQHFYHRIIYITLETNEKSQEIRLHINPFMLVEDIKFIIQDKTGIPWDKIKFLVEGCELLDHKTLFEYGAPMFAHIRAYIKN